MKKLDHQGMTLVEVIVSVAMLSAISLVIFSSTMLILELYSKGQSIYTKNTQVSNQLEQGKGVSGSGKITFRVNGTLVEINGTYYSQTDQSAEHSISFAEFKPN